MKEESEINKVSGNFYAPKDTVKRVGLSRPTLWRMERVGDFPARVQLSKGRVGYPVEAVEAWIQNRQASTIKPPRKCIA